MIKIMAFNPKYTITQNILKNLTKIEAVMEVFERNPVTPSLMASLRSSAKMASVHYSTKIEGNRLTLKQVEEIILKKKSCSIQRKRFVRSEGLL
jgi:Fic family protein